MMRHISEAWFRRYGSLDARVTPHGRLVLEHQRFGLGKIPYHVAFELARSTVVYIAADGTELGRAIPGTWIANPVLGSGLELNRPTHCIVPSHTAGVGFESDRLVGRSYFAVSLVVRDMRVLPAIAGRKRSAFGSSAGQTSSRAFPLEIWASHRYASSSFSAGSSRFGKSPRGSTQRSS